MVYGGVSQKDNVNTNTKGHTPMSDNSTLDDIMNITGPDTSDTDTTDTDTSETTPNSPYPNVLRVLSASEVEAGTNPEGCLTVNEFAGTLTLRAYQSGVTDLSAFVQSPAVYQALKAKRHPIPVVLVLPEGSQDLADARVFIPEVEGIAAWDGRPARGSGSDAAASTRSKDELMATAAKKVLERSKIQARLDRATEQLGKADKTVAKYVGWLAQFFANDRDAAFAAMQEAADALAAESESDSAIDDNGNPIENTPAE